MVIKLYLSSVSRVVFFNQSQIKIYQRNYSCNSMAALTHLHQSRTNIHVVLNSCYNCPKNFIHILNHYAMSSLESDYIEWENLTVKVSTQALIPSIIPPRLDLCRDKCWHVLFSFLFFSFCMFLFFFLSPCILQSQLKHLESSREKSSKHFMINCIVNFHLSLNILFEVHVYDVSLEKVI